jgi:hypothetical protein
MCAAAHIGCANHDIASFLGIGPVVCRVAHQQRRRSARRRSVRRGLLHRELQGRQIRDRGGKWNFVEGVVRHYLQFVSLHKWREGRVDQSMQVAKRFAGAAERHAVHECISCGGGRGANGPGIRQLNLCYRILAQHPGVAARIA